MIALIVAYAKNHVIGNKGNIPWKIRGEQRRFKELTTGNIVIMGRRSYEEIGHPLPNRTTIVISHTKNFDEPGCITVLSLPEAIKTASSLPGNKDIFISGGARVYEEALPLVEKMYITEIDAVVDGDTFFPEFSVEDYNKEIVERIDDEIPYTYVTYTKKD